jgi:3D-(3,5/4)-trihydroxycyclohexane-1,2-dione acylhydrolase (decyclizing)
MSAVAEPSSRIESRVEDRARSIRLTAAQALVRFLQTQYSERDGIRARLIPAMFGIFGHGNVTSIGQALSDDGADLPYYQPRNEQSMVHTAVGFARATRRRSALACTSSIGPGATNMVTGAATATINRLPVLLLPADIYATRRQGNVLQQLEHPVSADVSVNDCLRPVSRFFDRISRPEQLLAALPEAMRVLTDPAETGAVTIALPQDVSPEAYAFPARFFAERTWRIERRPPDPASIREAAELLRTAQRPAIIAGGGVHYSEAWDALRALSDACGIPVAETFAGKGSLREDSTLLLGGAGLEGTPAANRILRDADLVLCVGTRLSDFVTASRSLFQHPDVRFVSINVSGRDGAKLGALPVVADARLALEALATAAHEAGISPQPAYQSEIATARAQWSERLSREVFTQVPGEAMSQGQLIDILNRAAQAGDTVVAAAGGPRGDLLKIWDATAGRNCQIEFGYSCMGHEIPAGLGVRMAQPNGEVYVFVGDGTYLMNPTELVTAMQEDLKITVVVAENHGFQVIRRLQLWRVGRSFGNEFRARDRTSNRLEGPYLQIDFAKNAESMGARAWRVRTEEELRQALQDARGETRSCVIVAETEKHRFLPGSEVWWDAAPPEVSRDPETARLRAEYEAGLRTQRYFG